jgi:hypothetical protein
LAECLDRDSAHITLPAGNQHADYLARNGWFQEEVSINFGERTFTIPPIKWNELKSIRNHILTPGMKSQLETFRNTLPAHYSHTW